MKKLLYTIFLLLTLSVFCLGTNYYVDATSGSDSNNGLSISTPWKTLAKVNAASLNPSDKVYLKKGETWREALIIGWNGTSGNVIYFGAYGTGNPPIITAADIESSWTQEGSLYYASGYTSDPDVVIRDGSILEVESDKGNLASTDEWWYDSGNSRVYIYGSPAGETLEIATRNDAIRNPGYDYITFDGLQIEGGNRTGIRIETNSTYNTIQNCTIKFNEYSIYSHSGCTETHIYNCTIEYNMKQMTLAGASEYVGYCTITQNGIRGCGNASGCGIYFTSANTTIEFCEISYNGLGGSSGTDHGIYGGSGADNAIIRYCNIHDNMGIGITGCGDNASWYYCKIHDNAYGIMFGSSGATSRSAKNLIIYENTIQGIKIHTDTTPTIQNCHIFHNGVTQGYDTQFNLENSGAPATSNYNFIYSDGGDVCTVEGVDKNFAEWQALGYDANSINNASHGMTDPDNDDFTITASSLARNAGTNVGLTRDYVGETVPQETAPDIGAYEFPMAAGGGVEATSWHMGRPIIIDNENFEWSEGAPFVYYEEQVISDTIQHSMNFAVLLIVIPPLGFLAYRKRRD